MCIRDSADVLLKDLEFFGQLFESQVVHDLQFMSRQEILVGQARMIWRGSCGVGFGHVFPVHEMLVVNLTQFE